MFLILKVNFNTTRYVHISILQMHKVYEFVSVRGKYVFESVARRKIKVLFFMGKRRKAINFKVIRISFKER